MIRPRLQFSLDLNWGPLAFRAEAAARALDELAEVAGGEPLDEDEDEDGEPATEHPTGMYL